MYLAPYLQHPEQHQTTATCSGLLNGCLDFLVCLPTRLSLFLARGGGHYGKNAPHLMTIYLCAFCFLPST